VGISALTDKLVQSPWAILLGALMLVMTMLGTHFATSSDLEVLGRDVATIKKEIQPLQHRVDNLETDVDKIDKRVDEEISIVEKQLNAAEAERAELKENYHGIEVRLERMNGHQELTNEKLESIKVLFKSKAE
jgi:peptidoglycan hydrolase CwlO-like protein